MQLGFPHRRRLFEACTSTLSLAAVTCAAGVGALQGLALLNGHHGIRADFMCVAWCLFVSVVTLNSLLRAP